MLGLGRTSYLADIHNMKKKKKKKKRRGEGVRRRGEGVRRRGGGLNFSVVYVEFSLRF